MKRWQRWILIAVGIVSAAVGAVYALGTTLPVAHTATVRSTARPSASCCAS